MLATKPRIGILYWGNRGGGKVLADQLVEDALSQGYDITYFPRPVRHVGSSEPIHIAFFWKWIAERKKVINIVSLTGIQVMILPMASPWDLFLGKKLMKCGVRVTRIIHDASPHPGDIFPPHFWIRFLCSDADIVVTLSHFVASRLIADEYVKNGLVFVGELPIPDQSQVELSQPKVPRTQFLFIGRGRKYKGLDYLMSAWPRVGDENTQLTVAGEGHKVPLTFPRVIHIDRWLSDREVLTYINQCDVVVLPYIEASQSGLISIAHSLLRPVIVTPVGGLGEQIKDGIDGIITKNIDSDSLVEAMNRAINHHFDFSSHLESAPKGSLLNLCVNQLKS